jgi:hypothetical protein
MDKEPINSDRTREDARFSDFIAIWDHIAEQVNDGLHDGEDAVEAQDVNLVLELIGVTIRSMEGAELLALFSQLDIDLQALLVNESDSISMLMAHDHHDFTVVTSPVTDELPTWTCKCRRCGEERRVVRL